MEEIVVSFTKHGLILTVAIIGLLASNIIFYNKYKTFYIKYKEALKNSIIDPLTGLFNTRYLAHRLQEEISRASRFGHPLYLMFIDLDKFKQVNDFYGHAEGDEVLKAVAKALAKVMRPHDVVVRNGGDEFVILTAEISWENINQVADRIRQAVAKVSTRKCSGAITASIGLHPVNVNQPADDALKEADAAMYKAKRAGGNKVGNSWTFSKKKIAR